jgi:hypothetical protein
MVAKEQGRDARPDISISVAGVRKGLLMKVLEGNMTPNKAGWSLGYVSAVDSGGERSGLLKHTAFSIQSAALPGLLRLR